MPDDAKHDSRKEEMFLKAESLLRSYGGLEEIWYDVGEEHKYPLKSHFIKALRAASFDYRDIGFSSTPLSYSTALLKEFMERDMAIPKPPQ